MVLGIRWRHPAARPGAAEPAARARRAASTTRRASGSSPSCAAPSPGDRRLERHLAGDEAGDRRDRGQAVLRASRRRPARHHARRLAGRPEQDRSSRAARRSRSSSSRTPTCQSSRSISRKLKEAALAWQLEQVWSKDKILTAVPEHDLLRERRLRDRAGRARLLRARRLDADAPRGRAARRDPARPEPLQPGHEPEDDAQAAARGAGRDARAAGHHLQRVPRRQPDAAAEGREHPPPRHARAWRSTSSTTSSSSSSTATGRLVNGLRRRAEGEDDDRPRPPGSRAEGDLEVAHRSERARRGARRDRSA